MKCKVCGSESGKYPLCKECNQKKENGKIIKCDKCGQWHYAEQECSYVIQKSDNADFIYEKKECLLSKNEQLFFEALKKAVPNGYYVFPQINLATIVNRTDGARFHNELFRNLDFLITDENFQPKLAVEINDQSHMEKDRRDRDEKVNNILDEAGIPLLKLWTNYGINQEYINRKITELINTEFKRKHHFNKSENTNSANIDDSKSESKKQGCYIATCVYGSYDCPQVWILRRFRDYFLNKNVLGRLFINLYYFISPVLVDFFGNKRSFKRFWGAILNRLVLTLKEKGYSDYPYKDIY